MSEQKKQKRALIIYYSITGNTERVALSFKKVMEQVGWGCDMLKVNADAKLDVNNLPYRMDDYDFLCVGGPNYRGIIPKKIIDVKSGVLMPDRLFRDNPGWGSVSESWRKMGVVFVTYGGATRGTAHANSCLSLLQLRLEDMKIKCVGHYACAGGKWLEEVVDPVAHLHAEGNEEVANEVLGRYKDNPNASEFDNLTKEERALYDKSISEAKIEPPYVTQWHRDVENRPNERDLLKAEIFMAEVLEDFFGAGVQESQAKDVESYPHSFYSCIC